MNTHSTDFDLNSTPVDLAVPRRQIRGRYLAHVQLDARGRAQLAADIIAGKAVIDGKSLTIKQIVELCRTNKKYLAEARRPEAVKHIRRQKLAQAFNKIDFDSRVELCRTIGAERVWNALSAAID